MFLGLGIFYIFGLIYIVFVELLGSFDFVCVGIFVIFYFWDIVLGFCRGLFGSI